MNDTNEKEFPSVRVAYDLSLKNYDWAIQRLNAADDRIDRLLTWASSITLGVIAIVGSMQKGNVTINASFMIALIAFVGIIIFGIFARYRGSLILVDPNKTKKWLQESEWEFKKNRIFLSGEHFSKNLAVIEKKYRYSIWMIGLFFIEMVTLIFWILCQGQSPSFLCHHLFL